jgi:hypothetical protein
MDRLRHSLSVAAPALHGHQLDVPRGLRPRRLRHALDARRKRRAAARQAIYYSSPSSASASSRLFSA